MNPIKRHGYLADGKKAMIKLKEQVSNRRLALYCACNCIVVHQQTRYWMRCCCDEQR
jgi:hypothetical protein